MAATAAIDLIVMATRGLHQTQNGVALHVLRHARTPVLYLPDSQAVTSRLATGSSLERTVRWEPALAGVR